MMRRAAMALLFPGVPEVVMDLIDRPDQVPWRVREPTTAMVPAAIGNAVFDAIDVRLRFAPSSPLRSWRPSKNRKENSLRKFPILADDKKPLHHRQYG